jgi:hypothetical protein
MASKGSGNGNGKTPWFEYPKYKPVRSGWYECYQCNGSRHYYNTATDKWFSGKDKMEPGQFSWRGLAKEAKA